MSLLTDERMKEISDILGEAYIREKDAIGDLDTPGTMAFEINKLTKYVDGEIAEFGILSGCAPTIDTSSTINIGDGVVVYNYSQYNFTSSIISIFKTFQYDFDSTCHYGFIIAFNKDDLNSAALSYRSKLSNTLTSGVSTYIEITDTDLLESFSPPFFINVEGEEVEIWSVNASNQALIAPHYNSGTIVSNHSSGISVFINKPLKPQIFFGLPVDLSYQSGGDPETFSYYPPVSEENYILICRGLAKNPNTIDTPRTPEIVQIVPGTYSIEDIREFIDVPTADLFTSLEKSNIKTSSNNAYYAAAALSNSQSSINVLHSLRDFTSAETGYSFSNYWNDRPFVARSNFLRGESFYGITRFEFSDNMKRMYNEVYSSELLTTFCIFRGDIYSGQQEVGTPPQNLSATYEPVLLPGNGNMSPGTWIYRVSAVLVGGETSPSQYASVNIPLSAGNLNKIILSWDAVSGAVSYNVYRMGMSSVNYIEYLITALGSVVTNSYEDIGSSNLSAINRGIFFSGNVIETPTRLQLYIPPVEGTFNIFESGVNTSYTNDTTIQNDLIFTVYGIKSDLTVGGPHTVTVPQGTVRSTKFEIGSSSDLYIGVYDATFSPGTTLNIQGGNVMWSPYDLAVIQNI